MSPGLDLVDVMARLTPFSDLSHPQLEAAVQAFEEVSFQEGQRVLRQGFSSPSFYVIISGEASVLIHGIERGRLSQGDFFGEIAILLGKPVTADVVATTTLRCMTLPGNEVRGFLTAHPAVMYRVLEAEARRLQEIEWRN
ncbi:MAG: cyclic nucleotide-binding domain-containing protein [Actinomycetota bacterium]